MLAFAVNNPRGGCHVRDEIGAEKGIGVFHDEIQNDRLVARLLLTAGAVGNYIVNDHSVTVYTSRRRCRNVGRRRRTSSTRSRSMVE